MKDSNIVTCICNDGFLVEQDSKHRKPEFKSSKAPLLEVGARSKRLKPLRVNCNESSTSSWAFLPSILIICNWLTRKLEQEPMQVLFSQLMMRLVLVAFVIRRLHWQVARRAGCREAISWADYDSSNDSAVQTRSPRLQSYAPSQHHDRLWSNYES